MITVQQYFMGRDVTYAAELAPEFVANAEEWCRRVNMLFEIYMRETNNKPPSVMTSGWRPPSVNAATPGASKTSHHLTCKAGDLLDNGTFDRWCMEHPAHLLTCGLWLEHPGWTDGWCHLQTVPPRSGIQTRVFIPNENPPMIKIYGTTNVVYP